jgi:hypothetical protein
MHSPLSLAVGYNRVVTYVRRLCNNVVATDLPGVLRGSGPYNALGRAGAPLWCGLLSAPPRCPKPSASRFALCRAVSCIRVHQQAPNASPVQGCDLIVAGAAWPIGVGLWASLCWLRGALRERRRRPVRIPIRESGSVASICGAHYLLTARPAFRLCPVSSSAGSGLSGSGLYNAPGRVVPTHHAPTRPLLCVLEALR